MKARNKRERRIEELTRLVRPLRSEEIKYAFDRSFVPFAVRSRNVVSCMECGTSVKVEGPKLETAILGHDCVKCGVNMKVEKYSSDLPYTYHEYVQKIDVVKEFQVVRIFRVSKYYKRMSSAGNSIIEPLQFWISEDGKVTTLGMRTSGIGSIYYDQWSVSSELSIKEYGSHHPLSRIYGSITIARPELLPIVKRNGLRRIYDDLNPVDTIRTILTDPRAETLLKAGYIPTFKHLVKYGLEDIDWRSIRICIRNKYQIKYPQTWIDYIRLLRNLGKDTLNAFYVCPPDLVKAHDRCAEINNARLARERAEKEREELLKNQKEYERMKAKFFGLVFRSRNIEIKVLETVEEFITEGITHHHCVETYWNRADSLVLSARVNGRPTETVEVNLGLMIVNQSRGLQNKPTKYNREIVSIVEKNIPEIRKRLAV